MSTALPPGRHRDLLEEALRVEADAQRALLGGDGALAAEAFISAATLYRESYACAPPGGYGRLVGMLKASVIAGDATDAARHASDAVADADPSPTVGYVRAIAALILRDDGAVAQATPLMRAGNEPFDRAADAADAIVSADGPAFSRSIAAIVDDFAGRADHLTGVAIADTAVMFDRLGTARGLAHATRSALLPMS